MASPHDPTETGTVTRALQTEADYDACVALQRATWGEDFRELVPPAVLQIAQKMGGVAAGTFAGPQLIGFVFGVTGVRAGHLGHWSHMLAVDEAWRDRGIGRGLKTYQRAQVVTVGVTRMFWTFDPLVARNAHLNLARLGAEITEYVRNMYGNDPMSRTDSVIGSDRFVVTWDLVAAGSQERIDASSGKAGVPEFPLVLPADAVLPEAAGVLIGIPDDIQALKRDDPETAWSWRASTRRAFEYYLPRGYRVTGFVRGSGARPPAYRLTRP